MMNISMINWRWIVGPAVAAAMSLAATPASAQFFLQSPDFSGAPVRGDEPGVAVALPDASDVELRAGLVWSLRAALNVAALGCDFEPILLAAPNYNALLRDHNAELTTSFKALEKYFTRRFKAKKEAQAAFDTYQTRVYAGFTTVSAQYNFCQTASEVGRDALFTPRGELGALAQNRLRELRNSLVPHGEQRFGGRNAMRVTMDIPRLDPICWKGSQYNFRKCPANY